MKKTIAITGATGKKSGGAFFRLLNEKSDIINKKFDGGAHIIVRTASKTDGLTSNNVPTKIFAGDFANETFLENALKNVDTLVHIAGIMLSPQLVNAAAKCGVRRVILVHTTGIYSSFKHAGELYRQIDAYVEKTCKENHIILTILRPTMIYGNISDGNVVTFIKMVDKFPLMPVVNRAKYELQPVHYEDLAMAYYQVLLNEDSTANRNFDLSGGQPILLRDMLIEIGKNLGKKTKFISCPFRIAYIGAWLVYLVTFHKKDYREKVQRLCESRVYPHDDAREAFGYAPRTFEIGIVNEVKEYQAKTNNNNHPMRKNRETE